MPGDYSKVKKGWNILLVTATEPREKSNSSENTYKTTIILERWGLPERGWNQELE